MSKKFRYIWYGLSGVSLLIMVGLSLGKSGKSPLDYAKQTVQVNVAKVTLANVPVTVTTPGNLVASNTVTVRSRVDGQILKIAFQEGQMVQKNQILARIDPRPFDAALQQATANLHNTQAQLVKAKNDYLRAQELAEQGFASKQNLEAAELLMNQLQATIELNNAAIDAAKTQRDYADIRSPISGRTGIKFIDEGNIIRAGDVTGLVVITQSQPINAVFSLTEQQLPQLIRRLKQIQGQKQESHSESATESATDSGTIGDTGDSGDSANKVLLPHIQQILPQLSKPITVNAWDKSGTILLGQGKVTIIDNVIDPTSGTIKLKAEFANKDQLLWPGQFVTIRLEIDSLNDVLTIPDQAVQQGSEGPFVYVVEAAKPSDDEDESKLAAEKGKLFHFNLNFLNWRKSEKNSDEDLNSKEKLIVHQRTVTVVWRENGRAVLSKGLNEGETVVTEGQYRLRDGSKINIQPALHENNDKNEDKSSAGSAKE